MPLMSIVLYERWSWLRLEVGSHLSEAFGRNDSVRPRLAMTDQLLLSKKKPCLNSLHVQASWALEQSPCSMFRRLGLLVQLSFSLAADGRAWTCWEKRPISSGSSSSANTHPFPSCCHLFPLIVVHRREDEKGWFGRCFPRRVPRWVQIVFQFFLYFQQTA